MCTCASTPRANEYLKPKSEMSSIRRIPHRVPSPLTDACLADAPSDRSVRLHMIRAGVRKYSFLFFESRIECHDGRRIWFVRTLSGVERIELQPHDRVLYLGNIEHRAGGTVVCTDGRSLLEAGCTASRSGHVAARPC